VSRNGSNVRGKPARVNDGLGHLTAEQLDAVIDDWPPNEWPLLEATEQAIRDMAALRWGTVHARSAIRLPEAA
jgi:hypothetical protein